MEHKENKLDTIPQRESIITKKVQNQKTLEEAYTTGSRKYHP